jgi:WD40 repeat protein
MRAVPSAILAITALLAATAARADVSSEPVLRIEAEQHTAVIQRLAVDRAGKVLVTGAHDKTARVWSLPEGKLLKVLRPPIGAGDEGKVYAVAVSPDGRTVAVGHWNGTGENSVYLFDRESGQITAGWPAWKIAWAILLFLRNGRHLAAGLVAESGIRVWRTSDWQEVLADREYQGNVLGVAFAPDGRLAATSYDGFVRLHDGQLRRIAKEKALAGEPYDVAFALDGTRLAVGYYDTTAASVLSGKDLGWYMP